MSEGIGHGYLNCQVSPEINRRILVKDVLYVPDLQGSLLSVHKLAQEGFNIEFMNDNCTIFLHDDVIAVAKSEKQIYKLKCTKDKTKEKVSVADVEKHENCIHIWHRRFGHRDHRAVNELKDNHLVTGMYMSTCKIKYVCECCIQGKMTRLPFPKIASTNRSQTLQLVHSDLCGPMRTITPGGKKYFLTFIDDFIRYTVTYLLSQKSEAQDKLEEYVALVENKFGRKMQILRPDRGGEYLNKQTEIFLKRRGIKHETTAGYFPQQNGVAERKNRSLVEMAKCMLLDAKIDNKYWGITTSIRKLLQQQHICKIGFLLTISHMIKLHMNYGPIQNQT